MSLMTLDGYKARIDYDEETEQFRGEILGLAGGADFYGSSIEELRREFRRSLDVFLEVCAEKGIEPRREYSGEFNLRITRGYINVLRWRARPTTRVSMPSRRRRWRTLWRLTDYEPAATPSTPPLEGLRKGDKDPSS